MSPGNDADIRQDASVAGTSEAIETSVADEPVPEELAQAAESVRHFVHDLQVRRAQLTLENHKLLRDQNAQNPQLRYLSLFSPDAVASLTVGANSFILEANEDTARLLRVAVRDLVRARFTEFMQPQSRAVFEQSRKAVLDSGEAQSCEVLLLRRAYASFWAQLDLALVRDPETEARLCKLVVYDVSDRRRGRESMARLAALVESSNGASFSRDLRGRI